MLRSVVLPLSIIAIALTLLVPPMPGGFSARAETDDDARLRAAAEYGNASEVRKLLGRGANPNAPGHRGRTALHLAADRGEVEIVRLLLAAGGDPDRRDTHGDTPLHFAAEVDAKLPEQNSRILIRVLLDARANPGIANAAKITPLHLASRSQVFPDGVIALLKAGADANRKDYWGNTPLHLAVRTRAQRGIVRALLEARADPGIANGERLTPLQVLTARGPDAGEVAAMLLAAGADPDRKYANGDTMLHIAIGRSARGFIDIGRALLAGGADPCVRGARGYLPYQTAPVHGIMYTALDRANGHDLACRQKARTTGLKNEQAAGLDADQWRRIQSALADQGFDPGPVDGRPGPRTRSAISAWQRSRGYSGTGSLTDAQAEELLAAAPAVRPFGRDWIVVANQPCQLWNGGSMSGYTAVWHGACAGGKASGKGRAVWRGKFGLESYEGPMRAGKAHGFGIARYGDDRYKGEFRNGVRHGRGTMTWARGDRYEGGWRNDLMHGQGTFTDKYRKSRYEGGYRDGNKHGRGTVTYKSWGKSTTYSTCNGRHLSSRDGKCPSADGPAAGRKVTARSSTQLRARGAGERRPSAAMKSASAAAPEPKCSGGGECWQEIANKPGCYVWIPRALRFLSHMELNPNVDNLERVTVTWFGGCSGGKASGRGKATWKAKFREWLTFPSVEEGTYREGRKHGHWGERYFNEGKSKYSAEGSYVDGKRQGDWIFRSSIGTSRENIENGQYVGDKAHGRFVRKSANRGTVYSCHVFRHGKFTGRC